MIFLNNQNCIESSIQNCQPRNVSSIKSWLNWTKRRHLWSLASQLYSHQLETTFKISTTRNFVYFTSCNSCNNRTLFYCCTKDSFWWAIMKMLFLSTNEVICFVLDDFLAAYLINFVTVMACLICINKAVDQFNLLRWNALASGQNPILGNKKHKNWDKIWGIFIDIF